MKNSLKFLIFFSSLSIFASQGTQSTLLEQQIDWLHKAIGTQFKNITIHKNNLAELDRQLSNIDQQFQNFISTNIALPQQIRKQKHATLCQQKYAINVNKIIEEQSIVEAKNQIGQFDRLLGNLREQAIRLDEIRTEYNESYDACNQLIHRKVLYNQEYELLKKQHPAYY